MSTAGLRAISRARFSIAQLMIGFVVVAELTAVFVGAIGASAGWVWTPIILAVIAFALVVARRLSDQNSSAANEILRRLDLEDGLALQIHPREEARFVEEASPFVRWWASRLSPEPYFGSAAQPSPRRLLENLRESAWWTACLARHMATGAAAFFFLLVGVAVFLLLGAIASRETWGQMHDNADLMSALILFFLTQAPHQAWRRYGELAAAAHRVEADVETALERGEHTEVEAFRIVTEYQLARQAAPVIPTLWYLVQRRRLNAIWAKHRAPTTAPTS